MEGEGGSAATIMAPSGFAIQLVFDQELTKVEEPESHETVNTACAKPREGTFKRFEPGPSKVGHHRTFPLRRGYRSFYDAV
jgi:hypothetical protein